MSRPIFWALRALAQRALSSKFTCFVLLGLAAFSTPSTFAQASAAADDPVTTVDAEIVVSASLTDLPRQQSGSSVTVIDRQEIERRQTTTVAQLLRTVAGLEVVQSGGPGKATSVFLRGGNSSHTLVLIDGVRVNGNATGAFDFSDLTSDNIERIEILRGPQGVLYGSEAVSGVISIVTREGQGPAKFWLRGALGSDDFGRLGVGGSGSSTRYNYSFSASHLSCDGVSAASEANGNNETDPWQNLTLSGRLGGAFWNDGRFDLALRYSDGETDVDGFDFFVGPVDDLNAVQHRTWLTGTLSLNKPISDRWNQQLVVSHSEDDLLGEDPDTFFSNFEILSQTSSVLTQADLTLSDTASLSIGAQFEERTAENIGNFDESVDFTSFFAENLWSWDDRVDLSLGLRHDDHSVFGDETTYRLALSARLSPLARVHASAGSGFRAPTFNDLYFPFFGNLTLTPETSRGFDLGVELRTAEAHWIVDLTYFDTDFDDLILFTFPAGLLNVAEATSKGIEFSLSWQPNERWAFSGSHTYNDSEDLASGLQLARRPEHRSVLRVSFDPTNKLRGSFSLIAVSDRIDSDGAPMDDYERLDLSLDYRLSDRWRPFLRLQNLLDSEYAEIPGFTTPGATAAAGVLISL